MTAANYEWQLQMDPVRQQQLGLKHNFGSWSEWDTDREQFIARLTAEIIDRQQQIIALIAEYPKVCTDSTCMLPEVYATVSENVSPERIVANVQQYSNITQRIADSLAKVMACYLENTAPVRDAYKVAVVSTKPLVYTPRRTTRKFQGEPTRQTQRYVHTIATPRSPIPDDIDALVVSFKQQMFDLEAQFKRGVIHLIAGGRSDSRKEKQKYNNLERLNFEQQVNCLFSTLRQHANKVNYRSMETRSIQIALICSMERYASDELSDLCNHDPRLDNICKDVLNFIIGIFNVMIHAYSTGAVTSTVNLRYISPEPGGIVCEEIRKLNNLFVLGPLLSTARTNCNL